MNFGSLEYLFFCGLSALIFCRLSGIWPRRLFLALLNAVFLAPLLTNWQSAMALVTWLLVTYLAIQTVRRWSSGGVISGWIALVLVAFLILKKYTFLVVLFPGSFWANPIAIMGLSYMLFRFLHVLVDQWQGQIESLSLLAYANYQLSYFTILAGPIQRYNDYVTFWDGRGATFPNEFTALHAWDRIFSGVIQMSIFSTLALYAFEHCHDVVRTSPQSQCSAVALILNSAGVFYIYPVYIYFNFAGYTSIAIGSARLFGLTLPENFNRPWLARNVIDFWNRWHITLSTWIRDYVFMTSYKACAERFPRFLAWCGYLLLFLSLLLAGVWHGSTTNFAVFGLIHGCGVAFNQFYGDLLKRWLGRAGYQKYLNNQSIRWTAIVATFHFICLSFLFFSMTLPQTAEFARILRLRLK